MQYQVTPTSCLPRFDGARGQVVKDVNDGAVGESDRGGLEWFVAELSVAGTPFHFLLRFGAVCSLAKAEFEEDRLWPACDVDEEDEELVAEREGLERQLHM